MLLTVYHICVALHSMCKNVMFHTVVTSIILLVTNNNGAVFRQCA